MQYNTDVNNPDSRLNVKFYQRAVSNEFKSALEGRPIMEMADFILIEVPGNTHTVIDTFAATEHKERFLFNGQGIRTKKQMAILKAHCFTIGQF
jgi:hypothetical protein